MTEEKKFIKDNAYVFNILGTELELTLIKAIKDGVNWLIYAYSLGHAGMGRSSRNNWYFKCNQNLQQISLHSESKSV